MTADHDRRRSIRRVPLESEALARLRLRTGRELLVVNVASAGALVEADVRLLPGTCVDIHIVTAEGRELVRSRIVRALVWCVWADRIVYRGALAFERHVDVRPGDVRPGYLVPAVGSDSLPVRGTAYPVLSS